jgi:TolB-like protein
VKNLRFDQIQAIEENNMSMTGPMSHLPGRGNNVSTRTISGNLAVVSSPSQPFSQSQDPRFTGEAAGRALVLDERETVAASESAIRQQLVRILESPVFVRSDRLSRFLRFVVEHAIGDSQNHIKEYVIGCEVYDRKPPYHPSQDSIVRTEARRLRGKLVEYYEVEGKDDPVFVHFRPGSYIPVFKYKETLAGVQNALDAKDHFLSTKSSAIAIAILPFHDISGSLLSSTYARGIPDELAFTLMRSEGCRVISPASMAHFSAQEHDVATAMSKVGAQIAFEGSVREEGHHIRVTGRIVDAAGFQLWAKRFDVQADAHTVFSIEEQIASALSAGFDALFGNSQRRSVA